MFAYCGNDPIMGRDPTGKWTFSLNFSGQFNGPTKYVGINSAVIGANIAIDTFGISYSD